MTPDGNGRVLLWADDDGPNRFLYEEHMLKRGGWTVVWADSIRDALEKLGEREFNAILLDQMLPLDPGPLAPADVWGGCLILYWLRGKDRPSAAPQAGEPDIFRAAVPLDPNRSLKVIIVSAFHDDEVEEAIKAVEAAIQTVKKPIDFKALLAKLVPGGRDG